MTEARPLVEPRLDPGDIEAYALKIATGYKLCNDLMRGNLAFSTFPIGMERRPYILGPLIDFALQKLASERANFFHEIKWNAAHNCRSMVLSKNGLLMTQHFMGRKRFRKMARRAVSREPLAGRNLQLFADEAANLDLFKDGGYVQFLHGGAVKPEFIALVIPTRDQEWFGARSVIEVPPLEAVATEMIREEMAMQLKAIVAQDQEDQENAQGGANAEAS